MPRHQITPAPGSQTVPRRLNEITYNTPTAPPHIGNQPGIIHQIPPSTGSRTLTDIRQLNPFLPPSSAAPLPGQRSRSVLCLLLSPWLSAPWPLRVSPIQKVRAMPQISPPHTITQLAFPLIPPPSLSVFALFVILSVWPSVTLAEVRVVTAQGEYRMGDRDTREDAIRGHRSSQTKCPRTGRRLPRKHHNRGRSDVTKDEIRTYTAGLVLVLEQETNTTLDGDTIVVRRIWSPRSIRKKCDRPSQPCGRMRTPGINSSRSTGK